MDWTPTNWPGFPSQLTDTQTNCMLKPHYPLSTNSEYTVMSPTIYRERGYVFYFFSFDIASGEPPHVHVGKGSQRSEEWNEYKNRL